MHLKSILFLFFICLTIALQGQNNPVEDKISWNEKYKLKWSDFRALPDSNSFASAASSIIITYSVIKKDSTYTIKVFCYFLRSSSWTWEKDDCLLLKHEQGHFDIAELFARKFRKAISGKKFSLYDINIELAVILSYIRDDRWRYDKTYDQETDFSRDNEKQILWSKKIRDELNKLNSYKN